MIAMVAYPHVPIQALYLSIRANADVAHAFAPPLLLASRLTHPTKLSSRYAQNCLGEPSSNPWYSLSSIQRWNLGDNDHTFVSGPSMALASSLSAR